MVLKRVEYLLFDSDAVALDPAKRGKPHEIDREVRLEFADGSNRFVSWCSKPVQHCVGVSDKSFFSPPAALVVDGSAFPAWAPLIGNDVDIEFVDDEHQTVRIGAAVGAVLLSAREGDDRYRDVVHIEREQRRLNGRGHR